MQKLTRLANTKTIKTLRGAAIVICGDVPKVKCTPTISPCLFNLTEDPCEHRNVADLYVNFGLYSWCSLSLFNFFRYPEILQELRNKLQQYNTTALPPGNLPLDTRGDPMFWSYVFTNFGDLDKVPKIVLS